MPRLTFRETLPEGLLACPATELHRLLSGPTLIALPGRRDPPLFVSVLLHGNETSGLEAVQRVLRARHRHGLPRALLLFIGNVAAARAGLRRLDGQPDYNRVWPGTVAHSGTAEAALMAEVHRQVLAQRPFAAIDLHNNTGHNPHYAVVCAADAATLRCATWFARRVVWFRGLPGTQTASLAAHLPAITAECGMPGVPANAAAAARLVEAALAAHALPAHPLRQGEIALLHTLAVVRINPQVNFSFGESPAPLVLDPALERLNFQELAPGAVFGRTNHPAPLVVTDEAGRDVSRAFFTVSAGRLTLARGAIPAMLTRDARVIAQDCLCYLMERVPRALVPASAIG